MFTTMFNMTATCKLLCCKKSYLTICTLTFQFSDLNFKYVNNDKIFINNFLSGKGFYK